MFNNANPDFIVLKSLLSSIWVVDIVGSVGIPWACHLIIEYLMALKLKKGGQWQSSLRWHYFCVFNREYTMRVIVFFLIKHCFFSIKVNIKQDKKGLWCIEKRETRGFHSLSVSWNEQHLQWNVQGQFRYLSYVVWRQWGCLTL